MHNKNFHIVVIMTSECTPVLISNTFTRTTNFELNLSDKTSCIVFPLTHAASGQGQRSTSQVIILPQLHSPAIRGLLEKYPTFGREKETGLPGALDT